jgi:DNA-binding ferritin-like protein
VSPPQRRDHAAALNQVLSEVIDAILDVRQADRRVPEKQPLHAELDQLLADLRSWARLLADQDEVLGVSPLASMATPASRAPLNPWHGGASNQEVRQVVGEHLDRLGHQLSAALADEQDDQIREALAEVKQGTLAHRRALSDL